MAQICANACSISPDGRSTDFNSGIAPGLEVPLRIAGPHPAYAQAGDKADTAIDGEHLAMIARQPSQRTVPAWRIVAADLDTPRAQMRPEPP